MTINTADATYGDMNLEVLSWTIWSQSTHTDRKPLKKYFWGRDWYVLTGKWFYCNKNYVELELMSEKWSFKKGCNQFSLISQKYGEDKDFPYKINAMVSTSVLFKQIKVNSINKHVCGVGRRSSCCMNMKPRYFLLIGYQIWCIPC